MAKATRSEQLPTLNPNELKIPSWKEMAKKRIKHQLVPPITAAAKFNDLPNETILEILRVVDPYDLVNFCLTCKSVYNLSYTRREEDKRLIEKYGVWTTDGEVGPADLLRAICHSPRLALYTRKVEIIGSVRLLSEAPVLD